MGCWFLVGIRVLGSYVNLIVLRIAASRFLASQFRFQGIKITRNNLLIKAVDEQLVLQRNEQLLRRVAVKPFQKAPCAQFSAWCYSNVCSAPHVWAVRLRRCVALTGTVCPSSQRAQLGGLILKPEPRHCGDELCSASWRSPALLLPAPVPDQEVVAGSEQPTPLAGRFKKKTKTTLKKSKKKKIKKKQNPPTCNGKHGEK